MSCSRSRPARLVTRIRIGDFENAGPASSLVSGGSSTPAPATLELASPSGASAAASPTSTELPLSSVCSGLAVSVASAVFTGTATGAVVLASLASGCEASSGALTAAGFARIFVRLQHERAGQGLEQFSVLEFLGRYVIFIGDDYVLAHVGEAE